MGKLRTEMEELTSVWSQEEEKTTQMQKLISALFEEVTDQQAHTTELDKLIGGVKEATKELAD